MRRTVWWLTFVLRTSLILSAMHSHELAIGLLVEIRHRTHRTLYAVIAGNDEKKDIWQVKSFDETMQR